jgi:hypothetical protein
MRNAGAQARCSQPRRPAIETARAVQSAYEGSQRVIRTAVGLGAATRWRSDGRLISGSHCHFGDRAAKFPDAVERAIGVRPLPARVGDLFRT